MTKAKLIKEIMRREGKKSQVSIGNVREIISILEDICAEYYSDTITNAGYVKTYPLQGIEDALVSGVSKKFLKIAKRK
jgi:hypothetical protein